MARFIATAGEVIGGFTLVAPLHTGGMATIWSVTHPDWTFPLVMKLPLILDGDEPGMIVGFEVEEMILPRLAGPHAPRFVASSGLSQRPYIVMERVEGAALEAIAQEAPLAAARVAEIAAAVAEALHDLHRQHVLHLDLKPGNVLIRPDGVAVLIDFGLSRHVDLPDLLGEETRLPVGTGAYISPEQIDGQRSEPRSDLFALGVIMYRLVTGKLPFGEGEGSAMRRRLYRDPEPPRNLAPDTPPWLQEIILRCLEVDPAARYGTAAQLAFDLRNPDQVALTDRATRAARDGMLAVFRRRFAASSRAAPTEAPALAGHLAQAPIVGVAVDLSEQQQALADALRATTRRILLIEPQARLICLNVLKTSRLGVDFMTDNQGNSIHVQRLIELKHWARDFDLPAERVSCHVVESPDPADAIVAFARTSMMDHLVMGARASSPFRRYLGSVSTEVVAEAPCSVTIVRLPEREPAERPAS